MSDPTTPNVETTPVEHDPDVNLSDTPDPNCPKCNGTGTVVLSENETSRETGACDCRLK